MAADDKQPDSLAANDLIARAVRPVASARDSARAEPLVRWMGTQPELRIAVQDSLRSPALEDIYTPTEPPEGARVQLDTPVLGLSERPEPYTVRDRAGLVRLDGAMAGQVHSLLDAVVTVGRDGQCTLQIDDVGVSRQHAEIFQEQGTWWVKDAGSCNGTYLDGTSADLRPLVDGCIVRFGPVASYRFQLMDESHEATLKRLFDTSHRDALTGGHNRRYFDDRLSVELAFAIRHDTMLSVVLLDVDRFKQINDTYGHITGDAVLRHVAQTVRGQLRREDLFARYGGEEFVLLLRDIEALGAAVVAERVRSRVEATALHLDNYSISVTLSAGCAALEECKTPTSEALLSLADSRLYAAKRSGRNRVVLK